MRFTILVAVCLVAGLWGYACYVSPADTGPNHRHVEDRNNPVWIDAHRILYGCEHCPAARVYYDRVMVLDWGNWTPEEVKAARPTTTPSTAP
jgi:hypothetical protein